MILPEVDAESESSRVETRQDGKRNGEENQSNRPQESLKFGETFA